MADEIDLAQEREHITTNSAVNYVREQAARIEPGSTQTGTVTLLSCAPMSLLNQTTRHWHDLSEHHVIT